MADPALWVRNLRKTYGSLTAVEDVSFEVASGEIFGILGPNGAGKTTIVECRPDARPVNGVFGLYRMDLSASEGHRVGVARTNGQPADNH